MNPLSPHDPLDDLIAAALHGELSPEERAQWERRLQNDPAARAAYQETQAMHDLLERNHRESRPDPAFEERMVAGVREKIEKESHQETAWESLLVLWQWVKRLFAYRPQRMIAKVAFAGAVVLLLAAVALAPLTNGLKRARDTAALQQYLAVRDEELPRHTPQAIGGMVTEGATKMADAQNSAVDLDAIAQAAQPRVTDGPAPAPVTSTPSAVAPTETFTATMSPSAPLPHSPKGSDIFSTGKSLADASRMQIPRAETMKALPVLPSETPAAPNPPPATPASVQPSLKLIRNAQLELEVKSFQTAMDQITAMAKAAGGYVDSSGSEKGDNGKLQGTVVLKVLPDDLDAFLLKLREVGEVEDQTVSTENVTKDYYDTQARLDNARRMESQLQELLKHENSKVSDLLAVERELGRVRGDIEQMQGQLKLYDFQVQFATVTIQMKEKDLNQTAAYLLKEQDDFSLFAVDVEATFKKARATADDFHAQILQANLNHSSGADVSADLTVVVAPDKIDSFLDQIRGLGRADNFTRQTQRVAKDGGDSDQPADETRTDKDGVQVHISIRSDDESRKQAALTVVTPTVDDALDKAKAAALAQTGAEIITSSLNKTPDGQATGSLSVRVPGNEYPGLLTTFRALGRATSFSLQRDDNTGPGATGDDAPVIVSLSLTDDETPLQQTDISILADDVEGRAQTIKKDASASGIQIKQSNFDRQPDGTETAQLKFQLPESKYPAFVRQMRDLGKVETLTVQRQDQPAQTSTDDDAPVAVGLTIHNQGDVVPDDHGLWATLRETFGEGAGALFSSVKTIGVFAAFLAPWVVTLALVAWVARRIFVWKKGKSVSPPN